MQWLCLGSSWIVYPDRIPASLFYIVYICVWSYLCNLCHSRLRCSALQVCRFVLQSSQELLAPIVAVKAGLFRCIQSLFCFHEKRIQSQRLVPYRYTPRRTAD